MPKQPFKTDGMTIQQIMALGDDDLRGFDARDMSRAVRTLSLAANKRVARLEKRGYKRGDKWIEKKGGEGVDFNALYGLSGKFGVKGKTKLNDLRAEFARARNFLQAPSTTIKGAVELRKQKEIALFGETREQMIKRAEKEKKKRTGRKLTKKEVWELTKPRNELMSDVYDAFHYWKETYQLQGGYTKDKGNDALYEIGKRMNQGMTKDEAIEAVSDLYDTEYERAEAERLANMPQIRLTDKGNK